MPGVGNSDFRHYREQFDFEAQLGARLDHPDVVKVHDFDEAEDDLCPVMGWARGGSLENRLEKRGPLTVEQTVAFGSHDGTVKLWAVAGGRELCTIAVHSSRVYGVAFSPDGKTLASGSVDGTGRLWGVGQ
ncbi:MAG: hypothetical protein HYX94_01170 [Chloroflexi bacterium]|nr:hypothetical protein [Chloroflexota bacterium]